MGIYPGPAENKPHACFAARPGGNEPSGLSKERSIPNEASSPYLTAIELIAEASSAALEARDRQPLLDAIVRSCVAHGCRYAAAHLSESPDGPSALAGSPDAAAGASCEPIAIDGRVRGTLAVTYPAIFGADLETWLTRGLAKLIASAVGRVDAFASQQRVADRLQRALLPSGLPTLESLRFSAAYRPATGETVVGGDWFDAFEIGDGRIGVSIGDVVGHGLEAAVAMGEARRAIRTAAAGFGAPGEMLDYVNGILAHKDGAGMATTIAGFYDPRDRTFTYASAGHPPPILVGPDRRPHALPAGGLPLGLADAVASRDWTVTIESGTTLILYTDGLLEYSRDIIAGERILHSAIADADLEHANAPAELLHTAIFACVDNTDDAATLVLQGQGPTPRVHVRSSAFPCAAAIARGSIRRHLQSVGAPLGTTERVLGAVGEAVANAIEHGRDGGAFEVVVDHVDGSMHVDVRSEGPWREFLKNEERGRGLPIMQAFADGVAVRSDSASTGIHLTFSMSEGAS